MPSSWAPYVVELKAGCTDLLYLTYLTLDISVGDSAIVEADRGDDLSTVVNDTITLKEVEAFDREQRERVVYGDGRPLSTGGQQGGKPKDDVWKGAVSGYSVRGFTWPHVLAYQCFNRQLVIILQDEIKALRLCQNKVRQKKLPMEVIDAEYQWFVVRHNTSFSLGFAEDEGDQGLMKIDILFVAEKRIDFRGLVRELFRRVNIIQYFTCALSGHLILHLTYEQ